jgi:hypothetical protein
MILLRWGETVAQALQAGQCKILPGVTLRRSVEGGYSVERGGEYIGWIHASLGDQWQAYVRRPGAGGDRLGRFSQVEAVRAVVTASGPPAPTSSTARP